MKEIKDGGPAFPNNDIWITDGKGNSQPDPSYVGMSLRDYFAAKAMQGLIALPDDTCCTASDPEGIAREIQEYKEDLARTAYRYADAMLKAREQS